MPKTLAGIVYYDDDPDMKVFRIVIPTEDDAELDAPDPIMGDWTVFGVDPNRKAVMEKVPLEDARVQIMCDPSTPATMDGEPI